MYRAKAAATHTHNHTHTRFTVANARSLKAAEEDLGFQDMEMLLVVRHLLLVVRHLFLIAFCYY